MKKNFLLKGLFAAALFCFSTTAASAQQQKENKSDMTQAEIAAAVNARIDAKVLRSTASGKKDAPRISGSNFSATTTTATRTNRSVIVVPKPTNTEGGT